MDAAGHARGKLVLGALFLDVVFALLPPAPQLLKASQPAVLFMIRGNGVCDSDTRKNYEKPFLLKKYRLKSYPSFHPINLNSDK